MTQPGRRTLAGAAGLVAILLALPAAAATQGSLGAASRGSITISVSLRVPVTVSGLSDFALDGAAPAQDVCFKGAARSYTIAATGSGPGGALTLSNGDERIPYRVEWLVRGEGYSPVAFSADAPAPLAAVANPAECGSATGSGRLRIAFDPAAAERIKAGAPYTGALMLTLVPE